MEDEVTEAVEERNRKRIGCEEARARERRCDRPAM